MHADGFPRLVRAMDRISGLIDEQVVMQIGCTAYKPQAAHWFTFTSQDEMESLCERARIIVSHGGAGSILTALRHRRPLVVVPRRRKYGEAIDDHQLELADALSDAGVLLFVNDMSELREKLAEAAHFSPGTPQCGGLVNTVRRAVLADGN